MWLKETIFCIPFLLGACGQTTVDERDVALATAEREIADLTAQLEKQTKGPADSASVTGETETQLESSEASENLLYSWEVPWTDVSQGPCGAFRLSGTEILKLEFESEDGPYRWVSSGLDYQELLASPDNTPSELETWQQRPPDVALSFTVSEDRNHFFFVQWFTSFVDLPDWTPTELARDVSGILGANLVSVAGFLGPDSDCQWDWIPVSSGESNDSRSVIYNSGLTLDSNRRFVEYVWKDYSCKQVPPPGSTVIYDPELHMFVSQCRDD